MDEIINCPQCGGDLPRQFRYSKLAVCEHCSSTLFIEDDAVRYAGYQSVLADVPSLIQHKQPFSYNNDDYLPVGRIRYRYEHGFWDEWWTRNNAGEGVWISVDEGDYAIEKPYNFDQTPPAWQDLTIGKTISIENKQWLVTELGQAVCEGFSGELPELLNKGEIFNYAHLSETMGGLMTLEYFNTGVSCFIGQWIDHYTMQLSQS